MFDEYFNKYPIRNEQKASGKDLRNTKKALSVLIKNDTIARHSSVGRILRTAVPCAAAICCLTITAAAAGGWNFAEVLRSWFGAPAEENIRDKLSEVEVTEVRNSFRELEFECVGAVTDDNFTTLFIEITRTDGGILDCAEYTMESSVNNAPADVLRAKPSFSVMAFRSVRGEDTVTPDYIIENWIPEPVRSFVVDDGDPLDNVMTVAFCFNTESVRKLSLNGEAELELNIDSIERYIDRLDRIEKVGERDSYFMIPELTDGFSGNVGIRLSMPLNPAEARTAEPDITVSMEIAPARAATHEELINKRHPFTLKSVSVTSTSLSYELEGEPVEGSDPHCIYTWEELVRVNLKDGSSFVVNSGKPYDLRFYNNGVRNIADLPDNEHIWYEKDTFMLGRVIDVNDVVSVEIGGQTIEF